MKSNTKLIFRAIAVIFMILAVVSAVLSITAVNVMTRLFDVSIYKKAFIDTQTYNRLPDLIAQQIVAMPVMKPCQNGGQDCDQIASNTIVNIFISSTPEARKALFDILLKPEYLQKQIEPILGELFTQTYSDRINLVIPLVEIRRTLQSDEAYHAFINLILGLKSCNFKELTDLGLTNPNNIQLKKMPYCKPPAFYLPISVVQNVIRKEYDAWVSLLPETISLELKIPGGTRLSEILTTETQIETKIHLIGYLGIAIPLVFLLLATGLVVRSLKGFFLWWGIPLLITGILGLLLGLTIKWIIDLYILPNLYLTLSENLIVGLKTLAGEIVQTVAAGITTSIMIQSGIITASGGLLLLGIPLTRSKRLLKK